MSVRPLLEPLLSPPASWYLAAVAAVMLLLVASRRLGALFLVSSFPVTIAHELTHLLTGLVTNGRPSQLRLLPRRSANGYVLGSVTCSNVRWYNGLVIGLAPLLLLPVATALLLWRTRNGAGLTLTELPWLYLIACLAYASLPSWQDLRVAAASSWLLFVLAGALLYVAAG
jgi:hypothetical protein